MGESEIYPDVMTAEQRKRFDAAMAEIQPAFDHIHEELESCQRLTAADYAVRWWYSFNPKLRAANLVLDDGSVPWGDFAPAVSHVLPPERERRQSFPSKESALCEVFLAIFQKPPCLGRAVSYLRLISACRHLGFTKQPQSPLGQKKARTYRLCNGDFICALGSRPNLRQGVVLYLRKVGVLVGFWVVCLTSQTYGQDEFTSWNRTMPDVRPNPQTVVETLFCQSGLLQLIEMNSRFVGWDARAPGNAFEGRAIAYAFVRQPFENFELDWRHLRFGLLGLLGLILFYLGLYSLQLDLQIIVLHLQGRYLRFLLARRVTALQKLHRAKELNKLALQGRRPNGVNNRLQAFRERFGDSHVAGYSKAITSSKSQTWSETPASIAGVTRKL